MEILKEGMTVFYTEDSEVFSGQIIDLEAVAGGGYEFSINSYGACEGYYRISSGQVGKPFFYLKRRQKRTVNISNAKSLAHFCTQLLDIKKVSQSLIL